MKKFLLIILLLYPVISLADSLANNKLYLTLNANNKIRYGTSPDISGGIGYYPANNYRIDITGSDSLFSPDDRYVPYSEKLGGLVISGTKHVIYKTRIKYLLLNNYYDIVNNDDYKIFFSGGIGAAKIKEKITHLFSGTTINGEAIIIPLYVEHFRNKRTTNFIYSLGGGIAVKVKNKVNVDFAYSYKDFGKPKYKKADISYFRSIKQYTSHNFSVGLRFDL